MIKLFSVKEKQKQVAEANNGAIPKQTAGELRMQKDMSELNLPKGATIHFPEGKDKIMAFEITLRPEEGTYREGAFVFSFSVPATYPHEPPKVKCLTKIFHPNLDLEGNICLNILREDWKPVLSINSIIYGLGFLFADPNPEDPLNKEAAQMLSTNPQGFKAAVERAIRQGNFINNTFFPPCSAKGGK